MKSDAFRRTINLIVDCDLNSIAPEIFSLEFLEGARIRYTNSLQ
jgi:hypothetical protein